MIKFSIKLDEIQKEFIKESNGKRYLNLVAWESPDKYGHTHIIKQDIPQEQREKDKLNNVLRPIVGNLDASRLIDSARGAVARVHQANQPVAAAGSAPSPEQDYFDPPF